MGAEGWVLRGGTLRTPPGPEGSNGKEVLSGAVGVPDSQYPLGIIPRYVGRWGACRPLVVCEV